jgi:carbonic anhydrase
MRISMSLVRWTLKTAVLPILLLAAACASHPYPHPVSCCDVEWGYEDPEHWADLTPCYTECRTGGEQSPIDLVLADARREPLPEVDFSSYGTVPGLSAKYNGHTIRIDIPKTTPDSLASLRLGGVTYRVDQFHFHARSEHTKSGVHERMEIHLVNISPGGRVVAVGIFVKAGSSNPELAKIWQNLPTPSQPVRTVGDINLAGLLPRGRSSYRYSGSLTNPVCNQGFQWIVYDEPIELAEVDIVQFQNIFSGSHFPQGNRRPVQPLNGRVVVTDVPRP